MKRLVYVALACAWSLPSFAEEIVVSPILANSAKTILTASCYPCHGQPSRAIKGDFGYLLDHAKLLEGQRTKKILDKIVEKVFDREDPMPPVGAKERLTDEDRKILKAWVAAGAPAWAMGDVAVPYVKGPDKTVGDNEVIDLVVNDLKDAAPEQRPYLRYFSFHHLPNTPKVSFSYYRDGLVKLLNYLSTNKKIVVPTKVEGSEYLVKVDMRKLGWKDAAWTAYKTKYPYAKSELNEKSLLSLARYNTTWADHFVAKASVGDLYFQFLNIPVAESDVEKAQDIDTIASIRKGNVVRSGMRVSKTEANNRIIEGHTVDGVYRYWRSFNFDANTKRGNISAFPMGPALALEGFEKPYGFEHNDSDILYFLPNGTHGYVTMSKDGKRETEANAKTGLKCMGCHGNGLVFAKDQVRDAVLASNDAFDKQVVARVRRAYVDPDRFKAILKEANKPFLKALEEMKLSTSAADGLNATSADSEVINVVVREYESEMPLAAVLSAVGASVEDLRLRVKFNPDLNRSMSGLFSPTGGGLRRDVFEEVYPMLRPRGKDEPVPKVASLTKGKVVTFTLEGAKLQGVIAEDWLGNPDVKIRVQVTSGPVNTTLVGTYLRIPASLLTE